MALKSFIRYCPQCQARYNVFWAEDATFRCKGCSTSLRWQNLYQARLVFSLCVFVLPMLLFAAAHSRSVVVLGIALGALLYINLLSLNSAG